MAYQLKLKQLSSLEKVFFDEAPQGESITCGCALKGEEYSYQIAYTKEITELWDNKSEFRIRVESVLSPYITVRRVANVPVELSTIESMADEGYYHKKSGVFPDPLMMLNRDSVYAVCHKWYALWVSVKVPTEIAPGSYPIEILFENDDCKESSVFTLEILDVCLPKQNLIFTQWFHSDCIADLHNTEIFSEKHWEMIEKYIRTAADNGINMILTPIFTPPLDTAVGGERKTVQLVDCWYQNGAYSFGFERLERWIALCQNLGIQYFEISHLFTQWGAAYTPKIVVNTNEGEEKRFGWHVSATSKEYKEFIDAFLPKLTAFLKEKGLQNRTYFHISDEPTHEQMETYQAALELVKPHLDGFKIIDALSDVDFYKKGLTQIPVPACHEMEPFLQENISERWTYYCNTPGERSSNRLMAMPSPRNRILGSQLFKFDCKGFLHWGYNFYYSQYSKEVIHPFLVTDACAAFGAGDAFSVYPYGDEVVESLRLKVFKEAIQDYEAMCLLAKYKGKEFVVSLMEQEIGSELKFTAFPFWGNYIISYREAINRELAKLSADGVLANNNSNKKG